MRSISALAISLFISTLPTSGFAQTPPTWSTVNASGNPTERHENGFVAYNGKLYLLGGRSVKRVQIYDPATNTWTDGAYPPFQMHHFQAVVHNDLIYVIGAYTGTCCNNESGISHVWTYNPLTDNWEERDEIPSDRRRGSTGAVVYNNKIYIVGGLEGGHGAGSTSYNWFDEYDPATGQWKILPNAPRKRDHFHAVLQGNKIYLTGGRDTSDESILNLTQPAVDVYDLNTGSWSTLSTVLPTPRGGTTSILYRGEILVIGGESGNQSLAYNTTEALNPDTQGWRDLQPLNVGRHGTQATLLDNAIYIAAGAAQVGGQPELNSLEIYEDESVEIVSYPQTMKEGWNLLGLPVTPSDNFYGSVYDDVDLTTGITPTIWNTLGGYEERTQLEVGTGFWLKLNDQLPSTPVQTITGTQISAVQIDLAPGWNMIAGPSCDNVSIQSFHTQPAGAVREGLTYFYDEGGYQVGFTPSSPRGLLQQGVGYWIYADFQAQLTLDCGANKTSFQPVASNDLEKDLDTFGSFTVRDAKGHRKALYFGGSFESQAQLNSYQLPPRGPSGDFDVRFTDNMRVTTQEEAYIRLNASSYPLSIQFSQLPEGESGRLHIQELDASTEPRGYQILKQGDSFPVLSKETAFAKITFMPDATAPSAPLSFALQGAYPNPVNHETYLSYDVPEASILTIQVFDVTGREVLQAIEREVQPGFNLQTLVSLSDLSSGVYIYTLTLKSNQTLQTKSGKLIKL